MVTCLELGTKGHFPSFISGRIQKLWESLRNKNDTLVFRTTTDN